MRFSTFIVAQTATAAALTSGVQLRPDAYRGSRSGGARAAVAEAIRDEEVVQVSSPSVTVQHLNSLSLDRYRCHSILTDAPPEVDPFALVKGELAPLSSEVRAATRRLSAPAEAVGRDSEIFLSLAWSAARVALHLCG